MHSPKKNKANTHSKSKFVKPIRQGKPFSSNTSFIMCAGYPMRLVSPKTHYTTITKKRRSLTMPTSLDVSFNAKWLNRNVFYFQKLKIKLWKFHSIFKRSDVGVGSVASVKIKSIYCGESSIIRSSCDAFVRVGVERGVAIHPALAKMRGELLRTRLERGRNIVDAGTHRSIRHFGRSKY